MGQFTPNSSVVVDAVRSFGSYLAFFSPDKQYIYLLVRTDFFGSLKLFKYNANNITLVWKLVIKPKVEGRSGVIPFGVGTLAINQTSGDLFLIVDVDEEEMAALKSYLGLQTGWTGPTGILLLRISATTGQYLRQGHHRF